jgi:hypothetical protein
MFRNLLILTLLLANTALYAQNGLHKPLTNELKPTATPETNKNLYAREVDYKELGSPLPDFIVKIGEGKIMTQKDAMYNGNLLLMIFNPTCGHCEDMTDLLEKNIALFSTSRLLMVATSVMEPYMGDFKKHHHIADYPQIQVAIDSSKLIDKTFQYKMLPQINIYDKNRKLIKCFYGDTPIDSLKQYIQ